MKKKILIGSIFAALLMLSMPSISNIQAQPTPVTIPAKDDECSICPESIYLFRPYCILLGFLYNLYGNLYDHSGRFIWRGYQKECAVQMIILNCPNAPAAA